MSFLIMSQSLESSRRKSTAPHDTVPDEGNPRAVPGRPREWIRRGEEHVNQGSERIGIDTPVYQGTTSYNQGLAQPHREGIISSIVHEAQKVIPGSRERDPNVTRTAQTQLRMKEALEKRQKPKEEVQQGVGPKSVGNPSITGHVQVEPQEKKEGITSSFVHEAQKGLPHSQDGHETSPHHRPILEQAQDWVKRGEETVIRGMEKIRIDEPVYPGTTSYNAAGTTQQPEKKEGFISSFVHEAQKILPHGLSTQESQTWTQREEYFREKQGDENILPFYPRLRLHEAEELIDMGYVKNESFFEHNREEFMKKTKPIMDQAQEWLHRGERKVQEGIEKLGLDEPMKPTSSDKFIRHTESENEGLLSSLAHEAQKIIPTSKDVKEFGEEVKNIAKPAVENIRQETQDWVHKGEEKVREGINVIGQDIGHERTQPEKEGFFHRIKEELLPTHLSDTVIVAVDGSKTSHQAFKTAISQTFPKDRIVIYHGEYLATALEGDGQFTTVPDPNNERDTAYLRDFFLTQCQRYNRDCEFVSHKLSGGAGVVSRDLCEVARRYQARNIFLGSRGLSLPTRFFLGSVSWNCLNYCDCSITVVKDPTSHNDYYQSIFPDSWTEKAHLPTANEF